MCWLQKLTTEVTEKGWSKMPGGLIPVLGGIWEEPIP